MKAVGMNTIIIEQPSSTSTLRDFLDVVNEHGMCVIVEFGLWSNYWPRAEGGYVAAYESFRTVFFKYLQVRRHSPHPPTTPHHPPLQFFVSAYA